MPRRKSLPPDTRPDWRDPNMPIWVSRVNRWVAPEEMQRSAQKGIASGSEYLWRDDPTYNMKAKRK